MTVPPRPRSVASARTLAPCAMPVRCARRGLADPRSVVPIATSPPPAAPEAFTRAPVSISTRSETTSIVPPRVPEAVPTARTSPSTRTAPPVPAMVMRPVRPVAASVSAAMRPPARTRSCTMPSAAWAVSCTDPPCASITPVFVTSARPLEGAWRTAPVTSIDSRPSPCRSTTCVSAPASATRPSRAVMVPRLATCGATSAASPASRIVMVPAFSMRASGRPARSKTMRPARKFSLVMLAEETISPAASTCAPCVNTTPD